MAIRDTRQGIARLHEQRQIEVRCSKCGIPIVEHLELLMVFQFKPGEVTCVGCNTPLRAEDVQVYPAAEDKTSN